MRAIGATLATVGCLTVTAIALGADDDARGKMPSAEERRTLAELVAPPLTEHEERLRAAIQARVALDGDRAAAKKPWRYVSPTDVVMLGLQKNLALRLAGRQPLLAQEALLEARAVFNPVLQLSATQNNSTQSGRFVVADITRSLFTQGTCQGIPQAPAAATNGKPDVTQLCFARPNGSQELVGPAFATPSTDAHPGSNNSTVFSVELTQQLPWGPSLRLVETSTYNKTYYTADNQSFTYGTPWASSILAELTLPIPGAKGFGPYAPGDYAVKLAEKVHERAFWDVKTAINSILLQIDLAFWDLVAAAENLSATMENRKLVESLRPGYVRLYMQEAISRSDKAQIDAELARVRVEEELALSAYYSASTALSALLEDDPQRIASQILFPAGFSGIPGEAKRLKLDDIHRTSLAQRPELMARKVDQEASGLTAKFAQNQALRDVKLSVSQNLSQNASVYGYRNMSDSLNHLWSPDQRNTSGALTFVNPLGRRAANAAVATANANVSASEYSAKLTANDVIRDVNDAYSAYTSALTRIEEAQDALKLSELAYQQVERRSRIGEYVTQVELNRNRRDVLTARIALIAARIDLRRAQSLLLAAQGVIADQYPGMHAYNDFERYRLSALAGNKVLRYFRPDPKAQAAQAQ